MAVPKKVAAGKLVIPIQAMIDFDKRAVEIIRSWPSGECSRGPDISPTGTMAIAIAQIVQIQDHRIDDGRIALNAGDNGARA